MSFIATFPRRHQLYQEQPSYAEHLHAAFAGRPTQRLGSIVEAQQRDEHSRPLFDDRSHLLPPARSVDDGLYAIVAWLHFLA